MFLGNWRWRKERGL